jgi:hypothetical protein
VGFVVDKVALGQVFSQYFGFSWQFLFPYKSVILGWYNRPVRGRRTKWTQSHTTKKKKIKKKVTETVNKGIS